MALGRMLSSLGLSVVFSMRLVFGRSEVFNVAEVGTFGVGEGRETGAIGLTVRFGGT